MKYYFLALTLIFTLPAFSFKPVDARITEIATLFSEINNDKSYEIRTSDTTCGCGCSFARGYYKNGRLVKLVDYYSGNEGLDVTEAYLDAAGNVAFIFHRFSIYSTDENGTERFINQYESRYYFEDHKLIKTLQKGNSEMYSIEDLEVTWPEIIREDIELLGKEL